MPRGGAPKRPKNLRRTLRTFFAYLGHARLSLLVVAVLVTASGAANLVGTYMIKPIVNALAVGDVGAFMRGVELTAVIYAVGIISCAGYTQTMVKAAQRVVFDIRRDLLAHIETLPLRFFDQTNRGDVMSYFTNDVDTISEALNNSFANLVQALMQAVGTLVLLFVLDWRLTLVTIAFDILIMFYVRFSSTRSKRYFSLQQETLGTLDGYVEEMVAGQKVVKVFNREPRNLADFRSSTRVSVWPVPPPRRMRPRWCPLRCASPTPTTPSSPSSARFWPSADRRTWGASRAISCSCVRQRCRSTRSPSWGPSS